MTCDKASFLLERRWDRSLSPEEEDALDEHLAGCAVCREEADAIQMADVAFLDLEDLEPPVNIAAAVAERIAREVPEEPKRGWVWGGFGIMAVLWGLIAHFGVTVPMGWTRSPLMTAVAGTWAAASRWLGAWLQPVGATLRALSPVLVPLVVLAVVLELSLITFWSIRRAAGRVGAAG